MGTEEGNDPTQGTPEGGDPSAGGNTETSTATAGETLATGGQPETKPTEKPPETTPEGEGKETSKPEEQKVTSGKPPEKYDLKLPDGSLLDPSRLEKIAADARARGLSNEMAQVIVERESEAVAAHVESAKSMGSKWVDEAKDDKEIGGDKFNESVENAKRAIDHFGSKELREALDATGLGNHPELLRFASKIGKAMAEDKFVRPGTGAAPPKPKTRAEAIYGTPQNKS